MSGFTLHADFDRDGKTDGREAERSAREKFPGAILLPNLDNDNRTLPASVKAASPAQLDSDRSAVRLDNDDELLPIGLVPEAGTMAPLDVFLGFTGWSPSKMTLLDSKRRVLRHTPGTFSSYTIGSIKARSDLFIEVRTLAGSPLNRFQTLITSFAGTSIDERIINVSVSSRDALGNDVGADSGRFTIAPWLMVDNANPIEKLFICDVEENEPSVKDVRAALPDPAVLVVVPKDVANGDAWLQDQFEVGYCHGPKGVQRVVLHLPRLRSNITSRTAAKNLAGFVRGHLPSRNIGLFEDFWNRSVPVTDTGGNRVDIPFQDSGAVVGVMARIYQLRGHLLMLATSMLTVMPLVDAKGVPIKPTRFPDFMAALADVTAWTPLVTAGLRSEAAAATTPSARATMLTAFATDLAARAAAIASGVVVSGATVTISAPGWSGTLLPDDANQLYVRLEQMHHSSNYGGNMELGPPTKDAKLGKIVLGNVQFEKSDFVDPDLKRFLFKQEVQPIVEISTEWLGVGHVDEVAAFVPAQKGGHAVLAAAPGLALTILRKAVESHVAGLPIAEIYDERPNGVARRQLDKGLHPVTMMLRGKQWQHVHQPGSSDINEPPLTYLRLVNLYQNQMMNIHGRVRFDPGPGADRTYDAAISVKEVLFVEALKLHKASPEPQPETPPEIAEPQADEEPQPRMLTTNAFIEEEFITENAATLVDAFPDVPVIDIPVLYDFIPEMDFASTRAFLPNAANLVVAGNRLLIPQQFGPRMRVDDAVAVIRAAAEDWGTTSIIGNFDAAWVKRQGLIGVRQWFKGKAVAGDTSIDASDLASEFRDGFPGVAQEEVAKKIKRANASDFRGEELRPGWHRLSIPEDTVDLLELYIALVVRSLGLEPKFVDSWYYHLNHGEIHCGTNALRKPIATGAPNWWTL